VRRYFNFLWRGAGWAAPSGAHCGGSL